MSHDTDPTPLPPDRKTPPPVPPEADAEAADLDFPDVADLDLASLSGSGILLVAEDEDDIPVGSVPPPSGVIPPLSGVGYDSGVSFELQDDSAAGEERTIGVSRDALGDIPGLFPHAAHVEDDGHFVPHLEASDTGAFGEPPPPLDEAPLGEYVPEAEAASGDRLAADELVSLDDDLPLAEPASSSGLFGGAVPVAEAASSSGLLDDIPLAGPASASAVLGGDVPVAESASSSGLFDWAPGYAAAPTGGPASSSSLFGDGVAEAQPASASDVFMATPAAGDDVDYTHLSAVTPVAPASGWIDSQAGDGPVPGDATEAGLAPHGPGHFPLGGSDLFGSPPAPPARAADQSDVIGATAGSGYDPHARPVPFASAGPPADVGLTFDPPPGESAADDLGGDSGLTFLPAAEADGLFDSAHPAAAAGEADGLNPYHEAADYGSAPGQTVDTSSILGELGGPDAAAEPVDDSGIRLDSPGVAATVTDGSMPSEFRATGDRTEFDPAPSGADIGDAVEFSDHPDPNAADSGSLHISSGAAGVLDFDDLAAPSSPDVTGRNPFPDDDDDLADVFDETLGHPAPAAGPVSGILFRGDEPAGYKALPAPHRPTPKPPARQDDPSVVVDWMPEPDEADSFVRSAAEPVAAAVPAAVNPVRKPARAGKAKPPRDAKAKPARDPDADHTDPTRMAPVVAETPPVSRRGAAGLALGLLLGVGAAAGVYVSGLVPNSDVPKAVAPVANSGTTSPPATNPPAAPQGTAAAQTALNAGDPDQAVRAIEAAGQAANGTEAKAAAGHARLFARLRELAAAEAAVPAADAKLAQARTDLEAAANDPDAAKTPEAEKAAVRAQIHLGLTYQVAGDRAKAREVYADGAKKFPKSAAVFESALDRLDATDPDAGKTSRRPGRAEAERLLALALTLALFADPAPPAADPEEPAPYFWKAVKAAGAGNFDEATKLVKAAKEKHVARARALPGRGLNPLADPLEEVFPRCCDELAAYWELRGALYKHPAVGPQATGASVKKALDQLAAAEKKAIDLAKTATDLETKLEKANEAVVTAEKDLKAEREVAAKLEKEVKAEKELSVKADKELKAAKESVEKLDKTLKAAKETAADLTADLKTAGESLATERAGRKDADATIAAIAKDLRAAKLLPETADAAAVVAAARSAVARATGPDLSKLVPPELSAVAGTGLATGHLLDLAARVNTSEASARAAAANLTKTTARYEAELATMKAETDAAVKATKEAAAAEAKNLTDKYLTDAKATAAAHAAAVKKLTDANATVADKLTAEFAVETKKLTDEYAAAQAKLMTENAAALKKVTDAGAAKAAALAAEVAAEREKAADAEKRFRADLASALPPAAALDLWLPLLVELRRPADADPALDAAAKALKTAPANSDDAGKARAVGGVALLLKGDKEAARAMLAAARTSPAYPAAKGKPWATAADQAFASLDDPAFGARRPIDPAPRKNPVLAARLLDAGIVAYKDGRYDDAEKTLADAAWNNPDDAVAWYFLGATRWAAGKPDRAKDDFRQGAEREQARTTPARTIDVALSPIQGPVRDAITAARP